MTEANHDLPPRAEDWVYRLVQATQDAVITIDANSRIVLFNRAAEQMFGYGAEEVRGEDVSIIMPQPYRADHAGYISRYEQTGKTRAIGRIRAVSGRRKSGETFPAELSVTEISVGDEKQYGAFIRDISPTVQLQRELVDRERLAAIGTTAAKFAHEVSNPLNGMYTQIQLMQRRLSRNAADVAPLHKGVDLLLRDIESLNGLLGEFRAMSRREDFRFAPTSVRALCEETLETQQAAYAEAGLELRLEVPPTLPAVRADAAKLKQVLLNLLKNAAEAMPAGGLVELHASAIGEDRLRLEVLDRGSGVDQEFDVFAPFATTKPAGTGLGLAIVRHLVQAHDGEIRHAPRDGGGTVFTVELPLAEPIAE